MPLVGVKPRPPSERESPTTLPLRSRTSRRLAAVTISTGLSVLGAWAFLHFVLWRERPTVTVVDNSEEIRDLLENRRVVALSEAEPGIAPGPPPPVVLTELDKETTYTLFPGGRAPAFMFDPSIYYRRKSNLDYRRYSKEHPEGGWDVRTNGLGLRNDAEVLAEKPDLRILVTGDSHTDGLCPNAENLTHVLGDLLREQRPERRIETLNAGVGGYNLYNYLKVYERYRELSPDVFVVVVYGGNDFSDSMVLHRYFNARGPCRYQPYNPTRLLEIGDPHGVSPQELGQVAYFQNNLEDVDFAVDLATRVSHQLDGLCRADGGRLLCVYLPPPLCGQPERYTERLRPYADAVGVSPEQIKVSDRIADRWLVALDELGIESLDLRPLFRGAQEDYYWSHDHHLNPRGHRAAATALRDLVSDGHD